MVDQFSGPSTKLGQAAAQMSKQVHAAGAAATGMVASTGRIASAMSSVVSAVNSAASAVGNYIAQMARAATVKPLAPMLPGQNSRGAAWSIAQRNAAEAAAAAKSSKNTPPVIAGGHGAANLAASWYLGKQLIHGIDSTISVPADVQSMRAKLKAAGVTPDEMSNINTKASELSNKYKNMGLSEILHIINDGRTNMTGTINEIVGHIEPFVKLASFFKAYDGGKHAGQAKSLTTEIADAMKSGELLGKVDPNELADHAAQLAKMKIQYGDGLSVKQYLTAQLNSKAALMMTDDEYRYGYFPALVQSLGPRAGTSLATMMNKSVKGIRVDKQSAKVMQEYGMLGPGVQFDKKGNPKLETLRMAGQDLAGKNPFDWIWKELMPRIARGVPGMDDVKKMQGDFDLAKKGDIEASKRLSEFLKGINQTELGALLGKMFKDPNAVAAIEEAIMQAPRLIKNKLAMDKINEQAAADFENYAMAKQAVKAQADRLLVAATGDDFMGNVNAALNGLAKTMGDIANRIDDNKKFDRIKNGLGDIGALGWQDHNYRNTALYNESSGAWSKMLQNPMTEGYNNYLAQSRTPFQNFGHMSPEQSGWQKFKSGFWGDAVGSNGAWDGVQFPALNGGAGRFASPGMSPDAIPQSMAVRVDPIQVQIPPSVRIEVHGTVNGPVNGSGDMSVSASPSRGTATPDAGAATGQSSAN